MKQPINFAKGDAFFVFASLNREPGYTESARAVNGIPISLAGSSIKAHPDGWLYADVPNNGATWLNPTTGKLESRSWDEIGDGTYFGAGAAEISGTNPVVEFSSTVSSAWALLYTTIPATVYTDPKTYSVTETIHYNYTDGKQAKPDHIETLTYHRTGYKDVTGHITYDQLVPQNFPSVNSPHIDGYKPDPATIDVISAVPEKEANGNIKDVTNIERTVIYNQVQQAQVLYRDVNDSKNPVNLDQDNNLTGVAGQTITDPNVDTKIANLINKGYVLKNNGFPSDAAYDNDGSKVQTFYIDFVHGNQPVNPQTPGTPGKPINPNDPKGPKYPAGTDPKSLTKTITRTIHYTGAGDKTPKDIQQPVTFTQSGVLDKVTGQWITPLKWSATSQDVASEKTPFINGYHVTNVDRDSQDKVNVDGATIKNTDNNYTVTVTYAANGKIIPVDPNGNPIPNAPTPQYPTDPTDITKVTPNEPVPNVPGWTPDQPTVTPSDPGADTDVVYRVPVKDEGSVNVFVNDTTTGRNLDDYYWSSGTHDTGTKVDYDKTSTITKLTNAGYKVLNPGVIIPGEITKGEHSFTIYVEHQTTTVTPDTPGNPGQPVDPNNPNGPKYPAGTDINNLKKTGTQTIHYVGAGDKTPADNKQSFDFTKKITFDNVTGKIINDTGWNVSSHTFGRVDTPVVQGYHADKTSVGETTITPTDLTKEVTVTYAPNGNPIPNVPTPQYPTDPTDPSKVTPDEPVPNIPGMTPETPTVTPKDPGKDTKVIYNVPTQDEGIVNVIVHDETTGQNLPKYGWTSHTQKTGTKVDFDKPATIKNLENAGYKVMNPEVTVPSEITKGEVTVVINVEHGTVPVTPDTPGTPGQPINPNDPNSPKYPNGTDKDSLTKTITRTIHYVGAGDKTAKDVQQPVTFTQSGVLDKVTGEWITPLTLEDY